MKVFEDRVCSFSECSSGCRKEDDEVKEGEGLSVFAVLVDLSILSAAFAKGESLFAILEITFSGELFFSLVFVFKVSGEDKNKRCSAFEAEEGDIELRSGLFSFSAEKKVKDSLTASGEEGKILKEEDEEEDFLTGVREASRISPPAGRRTESE